jgi:hypothetical protein
MNAVAFLSYDKALEYARAEATRNSKPYGLRISTEDNLGPYTVFEIEGRPAATPSADLTYVYPVPFATCETCRELILFDRTLGAWVCECEYVGQDARRSSEQA